MFGSLGCTFEISLPFEGCRGPLTVHMLSLFRPQQNTFTVVDVGGQRSERSKWLHCFDAVAAVLFVCSLSCYDQHLFEEDDVNAMDEAVELFGEVVNTRYFRKASVILFLNKSDLFKS